jgi:site-specific recombinase XerD
MERKQIALHELISCVTQKIIDLNYCEGHVRHYKECWNVLKKYAQEKGADFLTHELAVSFLADHYGIELYEQNLNLTSSYKALVRRSVMILLEYQLTGSIIKRINQNEHKIQSFAAEAVEQYIDHLSSEYNLANGTLKNHYRALERLFNHLYMIGIRDMSDISPESIKNYLLKLGCCSKSYISGQINILRKFFDYVHENNIYHTDLTYTWPVVRVERYRNIPKTFTKEEISKILSAVDRGNPLGKRDYAILMLAVKYGLRVSDIKNLELKNFDFKNSKLRIIQFKTENPLELFLFSDVIEAVLDYVQNGRPQSESKKIFILHKAPYDAFSESDNLGHIVYRYTLAAGVAKSNKKGSMHMFRYSLASAMLNNETPLPIISDILGHSNLNSTRIYTKIDIEQLKKCALEVPYEA